MRPMRPVNYELIANYRLCRIREMESHISEIIKELKDGDGSNHIVEIEQTIKMRLEAIESRLGALDKTVTSNSTRTL